MIGYSGLIHTTHHTPDRAASLIGFLFQLLYDSDGLQYFTSIHIVLQYRSLIFFVSVVTLCSHPNFPLHLPSTLRTFRPCPIMCSEHVHQSKREPKKSQITKTYEPSPGPSSACRSLLHPPSSHHFTTTAQYRNRDISFQRACVQ